MPALVPQVGGVLETTPFPRLLVQALDSRFAGTLVLEEAGGHRHGIHFENGLPRKAKTAYPVAFLGEVLVEMGALSPAACRSTLERARSEKLLHGKVLLAERLLSERQLELGLREQLARQVTWMFGRPLDTRFGFFETANLLENWGAASPAKLDVLELLWRGLREHAGPRDFEQALAELGDRPLTLREDLPLDYFFFLGADRALIERLRLGSLASHGADDRMARVICLLTLTRALDLGARSAPPLGLHTGAPAPLSLPAPPRVPELSVPSQRPAWSEPPSDVPASTPPLDAASSSAPPASGPRTSPPSSEHGAAFDSAPVPSQRASAIPDAAAANLHLRQLVRRRASRPDASEAEREHAAMTAFARAEALVANGNVSAAKRELAAALELAPRPPYLAMSAWFAAQEPNPDYRKIARELERAYRLAEDDPSVRFYRGLVMQRLGKHATALRDFRFVLEKVPRHVDAMRQVRIYEARLRRSPRSLAPEDPAHRPRSGLFGWLRKAKP